MWHENTHFTLSHFTTRIDRQKKVPLRGDPACGSLAVKGRSIVPSRHGEPRPPSSGGRSGTGSCASGWAQRAREGKKAPSRVSLYGFRLSCGRISCAGFMLEKVELTARYKFRRVVVLLRLLAGNAHVRPHCIPRGSFQTRQRHEGKNCSRA